MSAESVVIYYGLKFSVDEDETDELQKEKHSFQITAQEFGLNCYWGNFSAFEDEYCVLIGKEIGVIGVEHQWNQELSDLEMTRIIETTKATLKKAGFEDEPKFLMHLEPDF